MNGPQAVALGEADADLVIENGRVLSTETRELSTRDVAVTDGTIAALPASAEGVIGEGTTVIDAADGVVTPGFLNPHVHIDSFAPFENAYPHVLAGGTTTVLTETSEFGTGFGVDGVRQLLDATAGLPVDVRVSVPPKPFYDLFEPPLASEEERDALLELLGEERVVGVGEAIWIEVVGRDSPVEALYERAREEGKTIGGHGTGCSGPQLAAFAASVTDDHEAITGDGVVERVENGIHAIGRHGSFRDDVPAIADAYERVASDEISLSTDWIWPAEILEGYMDAVVRRAIEEGVAPVDAVRMATLVPARHFGLDDRGSLAPGRRADVLILDDLESVEVRTVVSEGAVVVRDGEPLAPARSHEHAHDRDYEHEHGYEHEHAYDYPERFRDSVDVRAGPEAFVVPESEADDGAVRAIACEGGPVTSGTTVEPRMKGGSLRASPGRDALAVALLDRRPDGDGTGFVGFITGFGLDEGAVATSHTWQQAGVLAIGADERAMAAAVDRVNETGGGWAVVGDEVDATFPTPIGARCADCGVREAAERFDAIREALRSLGTTVDEPRLLIQSLTFAGIPALRLSFSGYLDVFGRKVVGLAPDP
jgi:adenine deaminase